MFVYCESCYNVCLLRGQLSCLFIVRPFKCLFLVRAVIMFVYSETCYNVCLLLDLL